MWYFYFFLWLHYLESPLTPLLALRMTSEAKRKMEFDKLVYPGAILLSPRSYQHVIVMDTAVDDPDDSDDQEEQAKVCL